MQLPGYLREATFLRRENRFSCLVELEGRRERAHLPNSGRLTELLLPGQRVLLRERDSPFRKTKYDLALVRSDHLLVSVDARLPAALVCEALERRALPPFQHYSSLRREALFGDSRLDLQLCRGERCCFLETKSVTLVRRGVALFPDAPTLRGRRHIESLMQAKEAGHQAAIIFVAQREDARAFSPEDEADPEFGRKLRDAARRGVEVYAHNCRVSLHSIELFQEIPVYL